MVHLPVSLERRLKQAFPRQRDRDQFVADLVKEALEGTCPEGSEESPISIGGTLHLFTDGGSRGNPGQSAIACIIEDPSTGKIVREHYEYIGIATNNIAEYRALIEGLKIARRYHPNRLICHLDSELIVKQMSGEYRVKMPSLRDYFEEIQELKLSFPAVEFVHIPREDNFRADALVNKVLDAHPAPPYEKPT